VEKKYEMVKASPSCTALINTTQSLFNEVSNKVLLKLDY